MMFGKLFIGLNGRPTVCQRIDWRAWSSFNGSVAKVFLAGRYFAKDRASISYQESVQAMQNYVSLVVWLRAHRLSFAIHHFSKP